MDQQMTSEQELLTDSINATENQNTYYLPMAEEGDEDQRHQVTSPSYLPDLVEEAASPGTLSFRQNKLRTGEESEEER